MNLRILIPAIFTIVAIAVALIIEERQAVLTNKVFLVFVAPSLVLAAGWALDQSLRFYWSVFGVYHNSLYHDALRNATSFSNDEGNYVVDLQRFRLSFGGPISKREFEVMFDPFQTRLLPIPWKRAMYLKRNELPFVASLDNYLLYDSPVQDAPGMRWTNLMLVLQSGIAMLVGWAFANAVDLRVCEDILSVELTVHGTWILIVMGMFLLLPSVLHATIISWKEARAYELMAVLLQRGNENGDTAHDNPEPSTVESVSG
ncbi:hypothetical protein SG34_023915 [Thalassomonas viridans]|uniref:Uncharacterized protein n=1 Tax=Thalassomonas viridans TaxID=137584 RepID=A0AAE9Z1M2_9GAMM|nr:hypothetical protein [Thalassomonas viridans]WDE04354.1 hypothetical protein SG34_023915 [Thalassomonas viridans]